jgi:phenylalanyl-tRNA synthetase beta chain
MPTIILDRSRVTRRIKISDKELNEVLFSLKAESKEIDRQYIEVEVNTDRPDMLISEGIVRAAKGILGLEKGEAIYRSRTSGLTFNVSRVRTRPYALAAAVYGLELDEEGLRELIQFQEKLHATLGRKRKKVAIGLHDLRKVGSDSISYIEVDLSKKFVPLGHKEEMSVKDVLVNTEQGKNYGEIAVSGSSMPAIVDEKGDVLSLPPVINSERTRISTETRDLFIDVTGTSFEAVAETLDVIVANLGEAGGVIGFVDVKGAPVTISPLLRHTEVKVPKSYVNEVIGVELNEDEIVEHLSRMRYNTQRGDSYVKVVVPPYRVDVISEIDVVEDVAMSMGYNNLRPEIYVYYRKGDTDLRHDLISQVRELLIGAGFLEIMTFVLTHSSLLMGRYAQIKNPISDYFNAVRNSLIPTTLSLLSSNQTVSMPVKVFEVGEVVISPCDSDTGYCNETRAAAAVMDSEISYEDIQAPVHSVLKSLGLSPRYKRTASPYFIPGRVALIMHGSEEIGILGEVSIDWLNRLNIEYPVAIGEIYLDALLRVLKGKRD